MNWNVHVAVFFENEGLLKAVTYAVSVGISRKRRKMESLLLQTTNRK